MEVESSTTECVKQIQVRFSTRLNKFKVTETPFSVPGNLNRLGLSKIINHLLATEKAIPFDFLIDDEFLRTTLEKYLQEKNRIAEEVIDIEYVQLLEAPTPESSSTHPDWISSIDNHLLALQSSIQKGGIMDYVIPYGCYDNYVRLFFQGNQRQSDAPLVVGSHAKPVLSVSSFTRQPGKTFDLVSSSQDASIYVWSIDLETEICKLKYKFEGHDSSVDSVSYSPSGNLISSASWDDKIMIWAFDSCLEVQEYKSEGSKRKKITSDLKRQNLEQDSPIILGPRSSFEGHLQCVSCVDWISEAEIISSSWDHTIRIWDVESGVNTSRLQGNKVCLTLDFSQRNQMVVTGHADKSVRVWDPRSDSKGGDDNSICSIFNSHSGWVTSVKWYPESDYLFLSGSHDSSIKVWDIRSKIPLYTITSAKNKGKILALDWLNPKHFVSGGSDQILHLYNIPDIEN